MDFVAVGGDARYAWMVELALREGMDAAALGLERAGIGGLPTAKLVDLAASRVLVMPNPFGKGLAMPLAAGHYSLEGVLDAAGAGTVLALFGPGQPPERILKRHEIWDLSKDETLLMNLARQTAEGAIHMACERANYELYGCRALIVGYGRIGQALHKMLKGYDAEVTVAARRQSARDMALNQGAQAIHMGEMEKRLHGQQIIFSTPPQRVLDARLIDSIDKGTLLIDLSSPPYGVDLAACHARWLNAWREPALPGRYCPRSAGKATLAALKAMMRGGDENAR